MTVRQREILNKEYDVLSNRVFDDAVAYGGWPMDMHSPKGLWAPDIPTTHINHEGKRSKTFAVRTR